MNFYKTSHKSKKVKLHLIVYYIGNNKIGIFRKFWNM